MTGTFDTALQYMNKGFSVIPVRKDKKPCVRWEDHQKQRADEGKIREWWKRFPEAGVAIVTGTISGVDVIDIDTPEGLDAFLGEIGPIYCPAVISPRGGKHLYIRSTGEGNKTGFLPHVDFRGQGGYVVAPPSNGTNGKAYAWIQGASIFELEPPPGFNDSILAQAGQLQGLPTRLGKRVRGKVKEFRQVALRFRPMVQQELLNGSFFARSGKG